MSTDSYTPSEATASPPSLTAEPSGETAVADSATLQAARLRQAALDGYFTYGPNDRELAEDDPYGPDDLAQIMWQAHCAHHRLPCISVTTVTWEGPDLGYLEWRRDVGAAPTAAILEALSWAVGPGGEIRDHPLLLSVHGLLLTDLQRVAAMCVRLAR